MLLYISAILPARSETFVYREVFALRARGLPVHTASVHAPEPNLGEPRLDDLASTAIPIYASGPFRLLLDATLETLTHPLRTLSTKFRALADILTCDDVPWPRRPRLLYQALAALALARRLRGCRALQPDRITHIHAHMAHVPTTIAMYTAHQLRIPFSFTGHANDLFPNRSLLRQKIRRAAFVSCISRWHQSFYHDLTATPLANLPIIRCGVDVPQVAQVSDLCPAAQPSSEQPAAQQPIHLLAVGRLIKKKGFDVLLDSLSRLHTSHPDLAARLHLSIAGDGPELTPLTAQAAALRSKHNLSCSTIRLLGPLPNPAVRALMQTADLFVLPCRIDPSGDRDGIPVVLMEAMAAAVPVISGRLPAIEELVEHDHTGLMVPPGDAQALANALARVLTDNTLRARLAAAGRQRVVDEFSEPVNIDRLMSALGLQAADRASDRPTNRTDRASDRAPSHPPAASELA